PGALLGVFCGGMAFSFQRGQAAWGGTAALRIGCANQSLWFAFYHRHDRCLVTAERHHQRMGQCVSVGCPFLRAAIYWHAASLAGDRSVPMAESSQTISAGYAASGGYRRLRLDASQIGPPVPDSGALAGKRSATIPACAQVWAIGLLACPAQAVEVCI